MLCILIKKCQKRQKSIDLKLGLRFIVIIEPILKQDVSIGCQVMGTNLLDASLASLINAMNPISISILAMIFLGEKIQKKDVASIIISLVGVYIIL
ncbi:DMT family transporter, partial [Blautia hominis]|nr:DMT family transporter [Blautia hominis]